MMKLETLLARITDNAKPGDPFGASHLPIYQTATFDLKKQEGDEIFDYSRSDNPTRKSLERLFAMAEQGVGAICTNTGLAALALLFETALQAGDTVLVEQGCYGGTFRLLKLLKEKNNITTVYVDFTDLESVKTVLKQSAPKLILCESPTNPALKVVDIAAIVELAHDKGIPVAVDNSMATFASQLPLTLGADYSVFSTTKFISGHGAVIAGAVVVNNPHLFKKLRFIANVQGRAQSPMDVFLLSLGLPTLTYRMKAQEQSALSIAKFLETHPKVNKVVFPGLESHPQYDLAKKQMKIIPAILLVEFASEELVTTVIKNTKLFGEKASFGCADSRIEAPVSISHASFSAEELATLGISSKMVRIAIGLEDTSDLIADLEQALG